MEKEPEKPKPAPAVVVQHMLAIFLASVVAYAIAGTFSQFVIGNARPEAETHGKAVWYLVVIVGGASACLSKMREPLPETWLRKRLSYLVTALLLISAVMATALFMNFAAGVERKLVHFAILFFILFAAAIANALEVNMGEEKSRGEQAKADAAVQQTAE